MRGWGLNTEVAPGSIWLYLMLYAVSGLTLLGTLLGALMLEESGYNGWLAVPVAYVLLSLLSYVLPALPQDAPVTFAPATAFIEEHGQDEPDEDDDDDFEDEDDINDEDDIDDEPERPHPPSRRSRRRNAEPLRNPPRSRQIVRHYPGTLSCINGSLYLDESVNRLAIAMRRLDLDVLTSHEAGMNGTKDDTQQLLRAQRDRRIIVTTNHRDFKKFDGVIPHCGMLLCLRGRKYEQEIVRVCLQLAERTELD